MTMAFFVHAMVVADHRWQDNHPQAIIITALYMAATLRYGQPCHGSWLDRPLRIAPIGCHDPWHIALCGCKLPSGKAATNWASFNRKPRQSRGIGEGMDGNLNRGGLRLQPKLKYEHHGYALRRDQCHEMSRAAMGLNFEQMNQVQGC